MMTNLLAILVSLAMMLTGATAPLEEPASRALQVSNLTVRHNNEEVTLSPFASVGVMTDGAKAVVDFFVGSGEDVYLPFQLVADESGLLMTNDNSKVTLKIDGDQLQALLGDVDMDEADAAVFDLVGEYIGAWSGLVKLMNDPDAIAEIQAKADAIYDDMVDRGPGEEGTAEYDDEIYDVVSFEYDLTARQLGALADAVYAADERLADYAQAYFKLLKAMPEDSGLNDLDSFEALMARFDNISMHVNESIGDDDLNISDMILHVTVPDLEKPLELAIHSVRDEDGRNTEVTGDFKAEDMAISLYMEASQSGRDMQMDMNVSVDPVGEAEEDEEEIAVEADDDAEIDEAEDEADVEEDEADAEDDEDDAEEDEEDIDDEDDEDDVDGEGDGEEAFYFAMDFDRSYDEETQTTNTSLDYALDVAEEDIHAEFDIDGTMTDDGEGDYLVSGGLNVGNESYSFEFNAAISDETIDVRADAANAVSIEDFDPSVLLASVSADALNLYTDESVQKLIAMGRSAVDAATGAEAGTEVATVVDPEVEAKPADAGELSFSNPQFNWLPEGYEMQNLTVDAEYQDVNCFLVNEETGDSIYFDISASFNDNPINHYSLSEDGSYTKIDDVILNEEIGEGYRTYTLDDGTLSYSIYAGDITTAEDVAHILSALTF